MLVLLLLKGLREVKEARVFRITSCLLAVVRLWNATMPHIEAGGHLVGVTLVGVHLLSQELDFLLLEVAWTYQLGSVHSLLLVHVWSTSSTVVGY